MSEKRFVQMKEFNGFSDICNNREFICSVRVEYAPKLVGLLNEQQDKIQQQERKIRKCEAEVGRQLKQIIELQEENRELRKENKDLNDIEWEKFKKKYYLE